MQKYKYESDGGAVYEFTYSDGTTCSVTFGVDGIVMYTCGGKKTKFSIDDCKKYGEKDVLGNEIFFTEDDADIVMLAVMVGEKRLADNNEQTETRRRKKYHDGISDPGSIEDNFLQDADREALLHALSKLKPTEQYIIRRLYLDDVTVSQAELAKELDIKEKSIKQNVWRIKTKIKKLINNN